jgi:predicted Zn-dependent protease
MKFYFTACLLVFFIVACNDTDTMIGRDKRPTVTYSYSCLDSSIGGNKTNKRLDKVGDLIRDIGVPEKSITDEVQNEYGRQFHEEMIKDGSFKLVKDPKLEEMLTRVMNELLQKRSDPSGIQYELFVLEDSIVNAFTFGGKIYITQGMLKKCAGRTGLLYAIIGHEIGHSEMGHIKATIQEIELSQKVFGEETGNTIFQLKRFLTASANQKNELEADYYGINLTNAAGYDVCIAVAFWKEMASNENRYSQVEDFFRTHPFSELRAECLTNHIRSNFSKECGSLNKAASLPQVTK